MTWSPPSSLAELLVEDGEAVEEYVGEIAPGQFSDAWHGVGEEYALSVSEVPYCKNVGIRSLLAILAEDCSPGVVLDILGGHGQIAMAARLYELCAFPEAIVTADRELDQVTRAEGRGLPAIPVDAVDLRIVRDGALDAALIAYGFHHIPPEQRGQAVSSGLGRLSPTGVLLLYEGLHGGVMERISTELVDEMSLTPHRYPHPDEDEMAALERLGEVQPGTSVVFDPQVFLAASGEEAEAQAADYYRNHYTLKPSVSDAEVLDALRRICEQSRETHQPGEVFGLAEWGLEGAPCTTSYFCGPTPAALFGAIFPAADGEPAGDQRHCVVIPRYGRAVRLRRP